MKESAVLVKTRMVKALIDDLLVCIEEREKVKNMKGDIDPGYNINKRMANSPLRNQIVLIRYLLIEVSEELVNQ